MNVIGPTQDPFMTLQIQVASVVFWLRPCFMFQLKTEQSFGMLSFMEDSKQVCGYTNVY
jgi:hypothetical protein